MKLIVTILVSALLFSCEESNLKKTETRFVVRPAHSLSILEVDSCEYLYGEWGTAIVLTHKGNCKFCQSCKHN